MEGLAEELHDIICLLEGSLWLLSREWIGERKAYCLLVPLPLAAREKDAQERCPSLGDSPGKAPQHGSPLSPSLLLA